MLKLITITMKILCLILFVFHWWRFETRNDVKSAFNAVVFLVLGVN